MPDTDSLGPDPTREAVQDWLLTYAWLGTPGQRERTVECIMAQDGWTYVTAVADRYAGAQPEPGPQAFADGELFALSALYECHDAPHLPTCPAVTGWANSAAATSTTPEQR